MEQSEENNTDQPESRAEKGEMNFGTGEDTNVNELKEVVVEKEEDADLAPKCLQEKKADELESNKVDFISEADNTNGVPENSMASETEAVECGINGESEEKNNSEEKDKEGPPTEGVDKVDDPAEASENDTEVVTDDVSSLNESKSKRIKTDETDNDLTGRNKENETGNTDKNNENDVSNKDGNATEDVADAEPVEEAEKAAEEAPTTEKKNTEEMGRSESQSTIIPGQITDNEESTVSKKSLISRASRRSVTFSDTEQKKTDEKTLEKVAGKEPVKIRKSRMQILDEIASATSEVVDDFDTAGKNR